MCFPSQLYWDIQIISTQFNETIHILTEEIPRDYTIPDQLWASAILFPCNRGVVRSDPTVHVLSF